MTIHRKDPVGSAAALVLLSLFVMAPGCFWRGDDSGLMKVEEFDRLPREREVNLLEGELLHVVGPDETFQSISGLYGVPSDAIIRRNRLAGSAIEVGLLIAIPAPDRHAVSPSAGGPAAREVVAHVPATSGTSHAWPVRGRVIRRYGTSTEVGIFRGIDVAAKAGTKVLASRSGLVRYVSSTLPGMGSVVILDHGGDHWTFYGHLGKITVQAGTRVQRGQAIGTVGRTGRAATDCLHFRIYRNGRPVDPIPLLK